MFLTTTDGFFFDASIARFLTLPLAGDARR
jgi:hypothetical protein